MTSCNKKEFFAEPEAKILNICSPFFIDYYCETMKISLTREEIDCLLTNGLIESPAELYELSNYQSSLIICGIKNTAEILRSINESKYMDYGVLMNAICVPGITEENGPKLSQKIINMTDIPLFPKILEEEGISEEDIKNIRTFFSANDNFINDLKNHGVNCLRYIPVKAPEAPKDINSNGFFANKTVVFTGTMLLNRVDVERVAQKAGATVQPYVKRNTDYLITGKAVGTTKTNAAKKFGTKILTEAEFWKIIKGGTIS